MVTEVQHQKGFSVNKIQTDANSQMYNDMFKIHERINKWTNQPTNQ